MSSTDQPSVRKNYIYRLIYEILLLVIPLVTAPYISRVLGADGVGIYSYTSSIMAYFTMFAALGTLTYGEREISQHRDDPEEYSRIFYEIELMTVATTVVCIILWLVLVAFSTEYKYYFLGLLPLLFSTMFDVSWFYTGLEKIVYMVLGNSVCKIIGVVLLFTMVNEKEDLLLYCIITSCVTMCGNLSAWIFLPRFLKKVKLKSLHIWHHLKKTWIYFVPAIATSVSSVLDKTLIGVITRDNFQNGYYEQTTKVMRVINTAVFTSVNSVMGARISYLFSQEKYEEIHRRISRSMDFILLLGFAAMFGVWGVADRFVPLFFGDGYEPVITLLCIMIPMVLIVGTSNCLGTQYYVPSGQQARSARYLIIGAVGNVIMNLCLIPLWSATGAAIASVLAELLVLIIYMVNCNHYLTVKQLLILSWKRILAGVLMMIAILVFGSLCTASDLIILIIQVIGGAALYFLLLLLFRDQLLIEIIGIGKSLLKRISK